MENPNDDFDIEDVTAVGSGKYFWGRSGNPSHYVLVEKKPFVVCFTYRKLNFHTTEIFVEGAEFTVTYSMTKDFYVVFSGGFKNFLLERSEVEFYNRYVKK